MSPSKDQLREWRLVAMAQSVQNKIESNVYLNLKPSVGDELDADDEVIRSVKSEALRF